MNSINLMPRQVFAMLLRLLVILAVLVPGASRAEDAAATVELGKQRYGENCGGFCHGAGGKGGRAPCIICGSFKRGGSDEDIIKNITNGIAGTPMGAFGEKLSKEDVVALVAYLRAEQKKKEEAQ